MHEVSIAEGILEVVERNARANGIKAVAQVRVAVGELAGVDIPSLEFAWKSVRRHTLADDAALILERPPGRAWCMKCGREVALARFGDPCPECGGFQLMETGGTELRVIDFVERTDPEAAPSENPPRA